MTINPAKSSSVAKCRFELVGFMGRNVNDLQAFSDIYQIGYIGKVMQNTAGKNVKFVFGEARTS